MPKQTNKRKNIKVYQRRRKIKKVMSIIVIAFLCIYIPTVIILATSSKPDLAMLTNGQIKDSITAEGIVLKEEQLYKSEFDGVFVKGAIEGEKVPAGYMIASIVHSDYKSMFIELENLKKDILLRKQNGDLNSGIFTRDLKEIEENIKDSVALITQSVYQNNLSDLSLYLEQISSYQSFRNDIINGLGSSDIYVEDLEKQATQLEQGFKDQIYEVSSEKPGFVTYVIDGLEEKYKYDEVLSYKVEQFDTLINEEIAMATDSNEIKSSKPFVKMVYGNSYYIAFLLDNDEVARIKQKEEVTLNILQPSVSVVSKDIIYGDNDGTQTIVYIEADSKLNELTSTRKINAEIVLTEYIGLKVPLSALKNIESYPFENVQIGLVEKNWATFVDVKVFVSDDTYAIIKDETNNVNLYDYYIMKPKKVTEGQIVK